MAIPDFQTLMLPVLRRIALGRTTPADLVEAIASEFGLTEADRDTLTPGGKQRVFPNRVHWAINYLWKSGLTERPARASYQISARGKEVLARPPERIDIPFLRQFPEFRKLRPNDKYLEPSGSTLTAPPSTATPDLSATAAPDPRDQIAAAVARDEQRLRGDLLRMLLDGPPAQFEQVVVDLMLALGYGSAEDDAGETLGRTGDGGVDGIIREDRLGLDLIYLQAKRYTDSAISVDQIRSFTGALEDKGARKGVFITTSRFTRDAEDYVKRQQQKRIVLIDSERLTLLMLRHDVGVRPERTIILKTLDQAYFEPDDGG